MDHAGSCDPRFRLRSLIFVGALLTNRSFLGWGVFTVFAILMVPTGRIRSFLFSFGPYAAVWFIFTALRSISDETPLGRTLNLYAAGLRAGAFPRSVADGDAPGSILRSRRTCTGTTTSAPASTGRISSFRMRSQSTSGTSGRSCSGDFLGAMILLLGMGLAIYFLIPSNPPWLAPEPINSPSAPVIYRVME